MTSRSTDNPLFLSVISRRPVLLKVALWFNRRVMYRAGLKVVDAKHLTIPQSWPDHLLYFDRLLRLLENVRGDIVECGVASGLTLIILAILNRNSNMERHLWGFDSFEGLPAPTWEDMIVPTSIARRGMFSESSEETVWSNLRAAGFDEYSVRDQITLVKGWFSDTLKNYNRPIALLHIDADLYDSTKCALENLWSKVAIGGITAFDEYGQPDEWPGEKKAVDEFLHKESENVRMCKDPFYDRYYVVKLR